MPAPTTPLLNGIAPPPNSFVLPDHKMVYMSVTKAACTSLRWMVADLAGEDPQSFVGAIGGQQSRLLGIHGRRQHWQRTPQLTQLPPEQLAAIDPADDWFVFAVVRSPFSRLWSAWESKFLVQHSRYVAMYSDQPWFPRTPTSAEQVLEDWRAFVHARPWETHPELRHDVHFQNQVRSVRPQSVNYTRVYGLKELGTLFADVHAHLEPLGLDQPLYTPHANETPLAMTPEVLEGGVREVIEDSYAKDFAAFGERWSMESLTLVDGWSQDALDHAAHHTVANQRIGDLSAVARGLRRDLRHADKQIQRLTGRTSSTSSTAPQPGPETPGALARDLRRLRRRATRTVRSARRRG